MPQNRGFLPSVLFGVAAILLVAYTGAIPDPKPNSILLKAGTVVTADSMRTADVFIVDGRIADVGVDLNVSASQTIDAVNKLVMPGGIDPHTHLSMPFMGQEACDDFYSGHAAALAGGTTFHIDFAFPMDHDLLKGFEEWRYKKAEPHAVMDYGFHMAVTSWSSKVSDDMKTLVDRHGINSFKYFLAYKGALMVNDAEFLEGLVRCKELGALPQVHAENGDAVAHGQDVVFKELGITEPRGHALSRPEVLEAEATSRAIRLAEFVGVPLYVVHVMGKSAAEEIAAARFRGSRIIGETVTSAISLNDTVLWNRNFTEAAKYVMSPPIRSAASGAAVKAALAGGALQLLGTDHAVFNSTQKSAGKDDFRLIPNGVNGIEERMHVAWEELVNAGLVSPMDYVRITSTEAAKLFNVYPRKGTIAVGSDADVIVLDPTIEHTLSVSKHHSRMDTNIYEGKRIKGKVVTTVSRGRLVWHNGKLDIERGTGRYVPLAPFGSAYGSGLGHSIRTSIDSLLDDQQQATKMTGRYTDGVDIATAHSEL
jgi:dihydropyrimidinase